MMPIKAQPGPVLLFNDECGVCRSIASWVKKQVQAGSGTNSIVVRPIGQDPDELRALNQDLNIWDAYATIHLLARRRAEAKPRTPQQKLHFR